MCERMRGRRGTREEPGTSTQGGALFSLVPRLGIVGIEPKTPGWLVQAQPPSQPGSGAYPVREEPGTLTQGGALFRGSTQMGIWR